jgi:hypothetical protein
MSIQFLSPSPNEADVYARNPIMQRTVDMVAAMIMDLHEEEVEIPIVLAMNDYENEDEYTLAFGGTTMSLEIYPDRIEVVDFNEGDEQVLESFNPEEINAATLWLINQASE